MKNEVENYLAEEVSNKEETLNEKLLLLHPGS